MPGLDDLGVERLSGAHAPAQRGAVARQVLQHQHPVRGGRRTERGDGVVLQQLQRLGRVELPARVLHEKGGAHVPGSEKARPGCLGPAGFGEVEVQVVGPQVEPEAAGDDVTDRVRRVRVQHHLGIPDGAGCEVDERGIRGARVDGREPTLRRAHHALVVQPAVLRFAVDLDQRLQRRAFGLDLVDLGGVVGVADVGHPFGERGSVLDVFGRQQHRPRHRHRARFEAAKQDLPPRRHPRQLHHHAVAGAHALVLKDAREAV